MPLVTASAARSAARLRRRFGWVDRMPTEVRGCGGKIKHPSRRVALSHARRLADLDQRQVNAYKCRVCHGWHIGHAHRRIAS